MEAWRTEALIKLLLNPAARIDERDDAAMDLAESDDPRARSALIVIACDRDCEDIIAVSAGESLAWIAARSGPLTAGQLAALRPDALTEYHATYSRLTGTAS